MVTAHRRRTAGRVAILAVVLATLCPLFKVYIEVGGLWLCRILKWEFSLATDRGTASFPKDIIVSLILISKPSAEQRDFSAVLEGFHNLALYHADSDTVPLKMTVACSNRGCDSVGFSTLEKWLHDNSGEMELLLLGENSNGPLYRDIATRGMASLGSAGRAGTLERRSRFAVLRERYDDTLGDGGLQLLQVLEHRGCYVDMSFPDIELRSQPSRINSIYAVSLDHPDPFEHCVDLRTDRFAFGDLVVIDGPFLIDWTDWRDLWGPFVEDGCLGPTKLPDSVRVESWIRANVHVIGQPNWIFVKLKITAPPDSLSMRRFVDALDRTLTYLDRRYKNSPEYRVHYVTVREMYNIARAAEAGWTGDAGDFRDHVIAPYPSDDTKAAIE